MRIAYQNYVDATGVTFIASSADANYPVTNIQDQRLSTRWRTTAITSQSVIVDLGSALAIDTVAILGHNVASTATVTLVGSDSLYASAWNEWHTVGSALSVSGTTKNVLTQLTASTIAYTGTDNLLIKYTWSGSAWSQVGSGLTVGGGGTPALCTLTASQIAFIESTDDLLSTYAFSGSVWSLIGSTLTVTCGTATLTGLTASVVAFMDQTNDQLRAYNWSGSVWTLAGSLGMGGVITSPVLATLTTSTAAVIDGEREQLTTYNWSGSAWSQVGSALTIANLSTPGIVGLSDTRIAFADDSLDVLRTYSWSGSTWSQLGLGVSLAQTAARMAKLDIATIAFVERTGSLLQTYAVSSTLTTPETITYDSDVMLKFFTSTSRRYWQVLVEGTTTGTYIEAGRVWLGPYMTIDPSSLVDFRVTKKRSDTVIYGKHRQKFADPGYGWRRFDLNFPETDASMVSAIATMYDTVGNHTSMLFMNFDSVRDWTLVSPVYCSIVGDLQFVNRGRNKATWAIVLEEDR